MESEKSVRFGSRKAKITIFITAGIIFFALIITWFSWRTMQAITLKTRLEAQWQSLDITNRSLGDLKQPPHWSANVFIGSTVLQSLTQQLQGYKLEYIPTGQWLSGTTITVKSVSVEPKLGYALANLVLVARKSGIELQMQLTGSITYRGVENVKDGKPGEVAAKFKIDPLELTPVASFGLFNFRLNNLWNKLAPDIATLLAKPELFEFSMPITDRVSKDLNISEHGIKVVVNKDTGATITFEAKMPKSTFEEKLSFTSVVFRPEGIWLMAQQSDVGQNIVEPYSPPAQSELANAVKALNKEVRKKTESLVGDPKTFSIWISPNVFTSIANKLSELSDEARTVTIQTTEREGRLAEEKWHDDLLGNGGAYAELVDDRSGTATLQLGKPSVSWEADGLRMLMPARASLRANIHFHFDPLIGGGMGTSVGIEGNGSGTINISAQTKLIKGAEGHRVAVLKPILSCDAIQASAKTDGVLKIDMGWISVPKVGAKATLPLGQRQIGIINLLDNHPYFVASPVDDPRLEKAPEKRAVLMEDKLWALIPPTGAYIVRLVPESIKTDASGINTSVSVQVTSLNIGYTQEEVNSARTLVQEQAKIEANKISELLKQELPIKECDIDTQIAILLGPIEIGPNNEIVKFAKNAWNDITKGPGPNNDLRKAVEAAGKALGDGINITVGKGPGLGVTIGPVHF